MKNLTRITLMMVISISFVAYASAQDFTVVDETIEFDSYATWHFTNPSSVLSASRPDNRDQNTWYQERATLEAVDTLSYSGIYSVAFKGNPETIGTTNDFRMSKDYPVTQGAQLQQHIHARVLVPESEVDKINAVVLFHMYDHGGGFDYSQTGYNVPTNEAITPGEWSTITHWINEDRTVRDDANLARVGIRINYDTDYADDPPMIFVDFVSTDPDAPLHPHLSVPQNVSASNITSSAVDLSWDAPYGDDEVEEYVVYRGGFDDIHIDDFEEIARTSSTNYTDEDLQESTDYHYRLAAVSTEGLITDPTDITWVQTVTSTHEGDTPLTFELMENYPNPFNPSTNIRYQIAESSTVTLEVYNVMGQRVRTLVNNQEQQAGQYMIEFNAESLASGMYIYRIEAGDFRQTRQMMLIK